MNIHLIVESPGRTFCIMCSKENPDKDEECTAHPILQVHKAENKRHAFTEASRPLCHYCGCPENALTTDCPRHLLSQDQVEKVRAFVLDYFDGQWRDL